MSEPTLYTPKGAVSLKDAPLAQIRLGIQGAPGSGKTWAALTFPNPVVVNLDRGLGAHRGRAEVMEVKLWDKDFCRSLAPQDPSRRNAVLLWLKTEAPKLTKDQTLIIDGSTGLQNIFDAWYDFNKVYSTKTGKEDDFAKWTLKIEFFAEISELYKTLQCNVVYICHEQDAKDKKTQEYTGKIKPLLTGSFSDQLSSHFTDWFRQLSTIKPTNLSDAEKIKKLWGVTPSEFQQEMDTFNCPTLYYWQTYGDDVFDAKASSLVGQPMFIPATYSNFLKFVRK